MPKVPAIFRSLTVCDSVTGETWPSLRVFGVDGEMHYEPQRGHEGSGLAYLIKGIRGNCRVFSSET